MKDFKSVVKTLCPGFKTIDEALAGVVDRYKGEVATTTTYARIRAEISGLIKRFMMNGEKVDFPVFLKIWPNPSSPPVTLAFQEYEFLPQETRTPDFAWADAQIAESQANVHGAVYDEWEAKLVALAKEHARTMRERPWPYARDLAEHCEELPCVNCGNSYLSHSDADRSCPSGTEGTYIDSKWTAPT